MTREQERQLLRKDNNHYLWRKPRAQWTPDDLKRLTGETHPEPKKTIETFKPQRTTYRQPIFVTSAQGTKQFESVALCAKELEMEPNTIYAKINGHQKNDGEFQFFKSKMNN